MSKIDLTLGKKSREVKLNKRLTKPKIPTLPDTKKAKKSTSKQKIEKPDKKLSRQKEKRLEIQRTNEEFEKRFNIKVINATKKSNSSSLFKLIAEEIKRNIPSSDVGIYEVTEGENANQKIKTILGKPLADIKAERYFSLGETTVFVNPCGISDENIFLNRLVTRFRIYQKEHLLVVSSFAFEAFVKKSKKDNIFEIIKKFGGRI